MQEVGEPRIMMTEGEVLLQGAVGLDLQSQGASVEGMKTGKRKLRPRGGGRGSEAEREGSDVNEVPCPEKEALLQERGLQVD